MRKNPVHSGREDIIKTHHFRKKKNRRADGELVKLLWVSRIRKTKLV